MRATRIFSNTSDRDAAPRRYSDQHSVSPFVVELATHSTLSACADLRDFGRSVAIVICSPVAYCTVSLTVFVCCSDPLVAVTVNV